MITVTAAVIMFVPTSFALGYWVAGSRQRMATYRELVARNEARQIEMQRDLDREHQAYSSYVRRCGGRRD